MCTKVKACNQIQLFTPEYICACDALDNTHFNYQFKIFTTSNIKQLNNKSFYHILLQLQLQFRHKNNLQPLNSNEWNIFKSKGLQLIHPNINSLLKIDELQYIVKSSNTAVIGISESNPDESVLQSQIQINHYGLIH